MRFLLTLLAGLLAPSLFAANLSFLAPTNDVLPTNLGRFRASNVVAAVNVGIRTNAPSEVLEGLGGFKFRSPATASSAFYDHTNSRFHILTHSSKTGYIEVAELDNAFVRNRMGIDSIGPSTPHPLHLWANGASRWVVGTGGSLYPENHNASIIGQSVSPLSLVATGLFANLGMPALPVTNIYSETNIINKNVGIGTNAPVAPLTISASSRYLSLATSDPVTPALNGDWSHWVSYANNPAPDTDDNKIWTWGFNYDATTPTTKTSTNEPQVRWNMECNWDWNGGIPGSSRQVEYYMVYNARSNNFGFRPDGWTFRDHYLVEHDQRVDIWTLHGIGDTNVSPVKFTVPRTADITYMDLTGILRFGTNLGVNAYSTGIKLNGGQVNFYTPAIPSVGGTYVSGIYTHSSSLDTRWDGDPTKPLTFERFSRVEVQTNLVTTGNGRIGAGTNSPQERLHVRGAARIDGNGANPYIVMQDNSSHIFYLQVAGGNLDLNSSSGGGDILLTAGSERMRLAAASGLVTFNNSISAKTNVATFSFKTNFIAINTKYTNDATLLGSRRSLIWANVAVTNATPVSLFVDQDANGTYEENYNTVYCDSVGLTNIIHLSDTLQPGAFFVVTNVGPGTMGVFSSKLTGL